MIRFIIREIIELLVISAMMFILVWMVARAI
jgi:hypothetical protein